jgi:hypothetical protein
LCQHAPDATAKRIEQELSDERQLNLFEGSEEDWEQQPLRDGPITVGIEWRLRSGGAQAGMIRSDRRQERGLFPARRRAQRAIREVFRIRVDVR